MKITVRVKPRSSRRALCRGKDGSWVAYVTCPPVDNRANEAVCELVAEHLQCAKSRVRIAAGNAARTKIIEIG